ncbi:uncharacterized protein BO66DRAFT_346889 [Aspergillus aculeatinus CBS 121060]|uniref:Uncharacterized protein n=1 Tax=Aspergillus aculeatinus CBS 121060 TaxID=1448322 RepID=A0ACD1HDE9_9EURO|nr:hypothetical protein BO66DRAFT_346889 [Aspergillus aculeatinus CBS 121060]RAH71539.1 hypothetical protein BO66DRAFT_346889 [Aspergillus aculeatinus CBS 121060]
MLATSMTPQQPSSNMACSLAPTTNTRSTIASRPKLTLQTSSLPLTFGTSSTGLSLSLVAGSTASPTVRNTFKNAYDVTAPVSATASPSSKFPSHRFSKPSSPYTTHNPYQLPMGVRSILRNSPLEPSCRRRSTSVATNGTTGAPATRRVFFPAKKQVSYRYPLEEEIQNVHYTARHSDLHDVEEERSKPSTSASTPSEDSDSAANNSSSLSSSSDTNTSDDEPQPTFKPNLLSPVERKKRKHQKAERQVRAVALREKLGDMTPQTPVRKRAKRRCEWRWTLGPLENRDSLLPPPIPEEQAAAPGATASSSGSDSSPSDRGSRPSSTESSPLLSATPSHAQSSPSSSVAFELEGTDESMKITTHEPQRPATDLSR